MNSKKELLTEIEALLAYKPEQKLEINPNYMDYLEISDLESIKNSLLKKIGKLDKDALAWLEQFKRYD